MWISDISIRRPVFAVMIVMALVVLGWISLGRLGVDLFPKVEFPVVSISTNLEGASPDATESDISDPIEEEVNTTSGIDSLISVSAEGVSPVSVQYKLNENVETIFMMPKDTYTFLSSRIVKEIARLGGDVSSFVPAHVEAVLKKKLKPQK